MKPTTKDLKKAKENIRAAVEVVKACIADKYSESEESEEQISALIAEEQDRVDKIHAELQDTLAEILP